MTKQEELNNKLIAVARKGNLEEVKSLFDQGADINAKTNYGWTALTDSSFNGHLEVVKYLIEQGADVNAKTNVGNTALTDSSREGQLEVVKYLIEQGADVNVENQNGYTALDYIIKKKMLDDIIPYVYNYKAFEKIYNELTLEQKHILFKHFMDNRDLLEQVNPRKMKNFIPDINKWKNNL